MRRGQWIGAIIYCLVGVALAVRLPIGLDLSDEAYYATFVDDWLNGGIASSTLLTLHQTAALLVYPSAVLFFLLNGSTDGLFLFLRVLFFLGAVISSVAFTMFLRKNTSALSAWLAGTMILAFIPFGLPAPSYNTLGQQWMTVGLAAYGCARLSSERSRLMWYSASAASWTVATIAYPSLIVALFGLCVASFWRNQPEGRPFGLNYFCIFVVGTLAVGWGLVIYTLSLHRLLDSIEYLSQINDVGGLSRKIAFSVSVLTANPGFQALCTVAILCGILRNRVDPRAIALAISFALLLSLLRAPTLYEGSHDALIIAALSGIGLLADLRVSAPYRDHLMASIYAVSVLAGITTTGTATNAIYNTCIGILPAAVLALASFRCRSGENNSERQLSWTAVAPSCALVAILSTSLFHYYGEFPGRSEPRQTIRQGFFSGIRADPREIELLDLFHSRIDPFLAKEPTLGVFAFSGLALGRHAQLKMPTAFPLAQSVSAAGLSASRHFYDQATNRPYVVVLYDGPYLTSINPMQDNFPEWYRLSDSFTTFLGHISIYTRR